MFQYLKSEYRQVVDTLEPVVDVKSKEEIAVSMVTLSHSLDCVASFISDIVITEFNRSGLKPFFMSNISFKLLQHFAE